MNLVNGPTLAEMIGDPEGRIATAIIAGKSTKDLVDDLYLGAYSRFPTASEYDHGADLYRQGSQPHFPCPRLTLGAGQQQRFPV